jgi:hypothetical protein
MASFTSVGDTTSVSVQDKGETVAIALSGTYNMVIKLQREQGSPSSGSWLTIKTVSTTANQTIAEDYITKSYNETLRLIVTTDTSGTCTATLTETSNLDVKTFKDRVGNTLATLTQRFLKLHGGLVRTSDSVVNTTEALALTEVAHAGRVVTANHATGFAITLPEATATGNVYTVFYGTTVASGSATIVAPSSSTSFIGGASISTDIGGVTIICNTGDDTITMNGGTTGGVLGTWFRFTDVASGIFMLEGFLCSTGNEADPFSAGV